MPDGQRSNPKFSREVISGITAALNVGFPRLWYYFVHSDDHLHEVHSRTAVDSDGSAVDPRGGPCGHVNRTDPADWQVDTPVITSYSSELLASLSPAAIEN